jgi:hypothetical protein
MATPILDLLKRLADARIDFVLVGGMAATVHGSTLVTHDIDVCVRFDLETSRRILVALEGLKPEHRMRPDHLALPADAGGIVGLRNLYVRTSLGVVDFLGEIAGVGGFDEVSRDAVEVSLGDFSVRVMSLDQLLTSKRAMGRDKDHRAVRELEVIRAKRGA